MPAGQDLTPRRPDRRARAAGTRRRGLRIAAWVVATVVVLVVGGAAVLAASFDPNSLKPRIVAAVRQATGRDLALNGDIGLKWSLRPTVAVRGVSLANPPGFSRPEMATMQELDLQLALWPLLSKRVEIERLLLVRPDIRLETNAQGEPNWRFTPEPTAARPRDGGEPVSQAPAENSGLRISARDVRIDTGTLTYRDGRTNRTTTLDLRSLVATAAAQNAPMHITADASFNGAPFKLAADTGPLERLQAEVAATPVGTAASQPRAAQAGPAQGEGSQGEASPWPVKLVAEAAGARLTADGTISRPTEGKGYAVAVDATVPDLAALAPFAAGAKLPPLRDVALAARVADSGGPVPAISALTLRAGASDLGSIRQGLRLETLDVSAPSDDAPMQARAALRLGDAPATAAAQLPPLARWTKGAGGPVPVDMVADVAGAHFTGKGSVAHPETLSGAAVDLAATIPDLAALSTLAGQPLPAVKSVTFQARLADANGGGLAKGAALTGIALTSSAGDVKGDASVGFGLPLAVKARLASTRIDADALSSAAGKPLPDAGGKPTQSVAPPPHSAPPAQGAPLPQGAPQSQPGRARLFSDQPIPFGLLQLANADVSVQVADLRMGGRDTRNLQVHVLLQDGRLRVDPLSADLPTGHMDGTISADASQKVTPVAVVLRAPGIATRTLLAMLDLPDIVSGNLEVYADLRGAGETPHAIAASLDGTLGAVLANGSIDNRLLSGVIGPLLERANLPNVLTRGGVSDIRCFAARMDAQRGVATFRTLALSSSLLTIDGGGSVNLGEETLALQLRPQARIGGTSLVVPLRATGAIRSPIVALDPIGTAERNAGTIAGAIAGGATPLGVLGGLLGSGVGGGGDACAGPVAVARGQPVPAASNAPPGGAGTPAQPDANRRAPNASDLLRQFIR